MKNFLGIDYGTKRIGLAINVASLVEPLLVLNNQTNDDQPIASEEVVSKMAQICVEQKIDIIVLGYSEAQMAEKTKLFAQLLKNKIDLPIIFSDETLSSHEVNRRMKEASFSLKKRQGPIDHYAAALILEEYLETAPRL